MRLLRNALKNRRTPLPPDAQRRHSTAITLELPFYAPTTEKTPAITMLPRDSSSSLPPLPTSPGRVRSPTNNPYCFKEPNLSEILKNESPEPWSLAAFTDYCQQNLCLENLNFIIETREYKSEYEEWEQKCTVPPSPEDIVRGANVIGLWKRILVEYTTPGGPQEINLPGDVRAELMATRESELPVHPDALQPAVRKIRELMQDSILPGFLNDVRPPGVPDDNLDLGVEPHHQDDARQKSRSIQIAAPSGSPTPGSGFAYANSSNNLYHKSSTTSTSSSRHHPSTSSHRSSNKPRSIGSAMEPSKSTGSASAYAASLEDTNSDTSDPSTSQGGSRNRTPLPPLSSSYDGSPRPSPRSRSDSGWKKFSSKLGLRKHRATTPSREPKDNEHAVMDD